jgi:23S rRNA maturation mini-RNase III
MIDLLFKGRPAGEKERKKRKEKNKNQVAYQKLSSLEAVELGPLFSSPTCRGSGSG